VCESPYDASHGLLKTVVSALRFKHNFRRLFGKYVKLVAWRTWGEALAQPDGSAPDGSAPAPRIKISARL
jgi:hypothetical protein